MPWRGARGRMRSTATVLTWCWIAGIVYASLFPFDDWRWPPGSTAADLLVLPWPRRIYPFDAATNLLGYLPLGLLGSIAGLRRGRAGWFVALALTLGAALLALSMEALQHLTPQRVPSLSDAALNACGAALGAMIALGLNAAGVLRRWQSGRERWIGRTEGEAGALALLLLWPVALTAPLPVPLGLGQITMAARGWLANLADGSALTQPLADWLNETSLLAEPLSPIGERMIVVLGLLAPCLLAYASAERSWRRALLALMVLLAGAGATTFATVLAFGPMHAGAWLTDQTAWAMVLGFALALAAMRVGPRVAAGLALMALTGLAMVVQRAVPDPYMAQNLHAWSQSPYLRFHGQAQWLAWLWPYMAIGWLLARLGRPATPPAPRPARHGGGPRPPAA